LYKTHSVWNSFTDSPKQTMTQKYTVMQHTELCTRLSRGVGWKEHPPVTCTKHKMISRQNEKKRISNLFSFYSRL